MTYLLSEKGKKILKFQETISGLGKFWLLFPFLVQLFLDVG